VRYMRNIKRLLDCYLLVCLVLAAVGLPALAIESFPPLVSEGESFPDIEALLSNISRHSLVVAIAFSPDGRTLASGGGDGPIRLWEVASGREVRRLEGHTAWVRAVSFSPDGRTLASGGEDGTVRSYTGAGFSLSWIASGGLRGNWLTCNAHKHCWRYDDGSFLQRKEPQGVLTPVLPLEPQEAGDVEVLSAPSALIAEDGAPTAFILTLRNRGRDRVYWVNVVHDLVQSMAIPILFHPPTTRVVLESDSTAELSCNVSAPAEYTNPQERQGMLHLQVPTAYGDLIPLNSPVTARTPSLQLIKALQTQDRRPLEVTLRNAGEQDLLSETVFQAQVAETVLDKVPRQQMRAHETITLSFALPVGLGTKNGGLMLTAAKLTHPVRVWEFPAQPITLPTPLWYMYALLAVLFTGSSAGVYYLRMYRHPLVVQLSASPQSLSHLSLDQLAQAQRLLHRTGRLATVLSANAIQKSQMEQAVAFAQGLGAAARCKLLAERVHATYEPFATDHIPLFTLRMGHDFMLNIDRWLMALPPEEMPTAQVLMHLQQVEETRFQTCLIISTAAQQQSELRQASQDPSNWLVTPDSRELTTLLLSQEPLDALARLIASQVRVTRISPYQTGGGVNKERVFFGRTQLLADIIQREPANYVLVGGRQLGKSSLLKALERRYQNDPRVVCHYLVLEGAEIGGHLARALDLPFDTAPATVLNHLRQEKSGIRQLFLIDEADRFVEAEATRGSPTLHLFRSLSEAGQCHFLLAGFWSLYRAVMFDYQSPIRNFGETRVIGDLELEACYDLATRPMQLLNLHYASDALVETLVQATGRRANLIAIVCDALLQDLGPQDRVIQADALDQALESRAVRSALSGWEHLSDDEQANRLDRIIVYATIGEESFTLAALRQLLDEHRYSYDPEQLRQSLARLELAFILAQHQQHYTFCVPLFRKMVQEQEPQRLLRDELRLAKT
jgi:hypothetical protein